MADRCKPERGMSKSIGLSNSNYKIIPQLELPVVGAASKDLQHLQQIFPDQKDRDVDHLRGCTNPSTILLIKIIYR